MEGRLGGVEKKYHMPQRTRHLPAASGQSWVWMMMWWCFAGEHWRVACMDLPVQECRELDTK